jgi:putative methyltransferase (TIGR04325 family)
MSSLFKTVAREVILRTPVLRENYLDHEFARHPQSFRGVYVSFADALEHAPAGKRAGYDHEENATDYEPTLNRLNKADYPVLLWLSKILPEAKAVFDLGGNLGVAYYAYCHYLHFPAELHWMVCEVSATVKAGRALAKRAGKKQLTFTGDRAAMPEADIFFTAGALQYIEESLADILAARSSRPRHVIVQRVPLQRGEPFITLQNNGAWVVPYKVDNEDVFIESLVALGYELVDRWNTPRQLQVLDHPFDHVATYQGMYFRLR